MNKAIMKALRFVRDKLRKNFTLISTALLTFVLCLGVGLLISAIVNSVLLRHFPLPTPDQLESMFDEKLSFNFRLAGARTFLSAAMPEPRSGSENVSNPRGHQKFLNQKPPESDNCKCSISLLLRADLNSSPGRTSFVAADRKVRVPANRKSQI